MKDCAELCRRITASKKPHAKSSSSGAAPEDDGQTQSQAPETPTKPAKSSNVGRRRVTRKAQLVAAVEGSSQPVGTPDEANTDKVSRLLQDDRSAEAGGDSAAARSTVAKARKSPRRRKALVRVAPVLEDSVAGHQATLSDPSTTGHSSASKSSKAAGSSSKGSQHCKALDAEPFASSLCSGAELSPITEEQISQRSVTRQVSSPADDMAGGAAAARAGQPWALPAQDAWCYIASSPELSVQASPQLAACLSSPRDSHTEVHRNIDGSSKAAQMQTSGVAKVSARPRRTILNSACHSRCCCVDVSMHV